MDSLDLVLIFSTMKKIIKPAEQEECIYFSDFSGKPLGDLDPPVELKISFNYGSKNDGNEILLDLDDSDVELIIDFLKKNISTDCEKLKNLI
jgi:hypothetical protein